MPTVTFTRCAHNWNFMVKMHLFLNGKKLGSLQNGEEQIVEIEPGQYTIEVKAIFMRSDIISFTVNENEDLQLFIAIDMAKISKFHLSTNASFLYKIPLGIYENQSDIPVMQATQQRELPPFSLSIVWKILVTTIGILPLLSGILKNETPGNLVFFVIILFASLVQLWLPQKKKTPQMQYYIELNMGVGFCLLVLYLQSNMIKSVLITTLICGGLLLILFFSKLIFRKNKIAT